MVVLVGFMGAGKSSVGRGLAARLDLPFVDADEAVERAAGKSIPEIFEQKGEAGFRALESEVTIALLAGEEAVVALGGGAVETTEIRSLLEDATVVYLELGAEEALTRIGDPSTRPMLRSHDPRALHARRVPLYETIADVRVPAGQRSVEELVDEVVALLESTGSFSR